MSVDTGIRKLRTSSHCFWIYEDSGGWCTGPAEKEISGDAYCGVHWPVLFMSRLKKAYLEVEEILNAEI